MRLKITNDIRKFFTLHRPEEYWSDEPTLANSIRYKIDLVGVSKRLGLPYGWSYREVGGPAQYIRNDLMELYQIARDVQGEPWRIYELDSQQDILNLLDSRREHFKKLWERFPPAPMPVEPKIVPLRYELWYATLDELITLYQNRGEPPYFTQYILRKVSTRNRVPTYLSSGCGGESTRRRQTVYRRDLAHLIQVGAISTNDSLSDEVLHELRLEHDVYVMLPWMRG